MQRQVIPLKLIEKNISDMNLAAYNPRITLTPDMDEYQRLWHSIDTFGFVVPVIWNKRTNTVVGGHQRITVARDHGIEKVPVTVVDLEVEDEKALNIVLNKVEGEWDEVKLKSLLDEIGEDAAKEAGFSDAELAAMENSIDDYIDHELIENEESKVPETFNLTLTFPADKEELVQQWVKDVGKPAAVQLIIDTVKGEE